MVAGNGPTIMSYTRPDAAVDDADQARRKSPQPHRWRDQYRRDGTGVIASVDQLFEFSSGRQPIFAQETVGCVANARSAGETERITRFITPG
jgi:hypothetical protein